MKTIGLLIALLTLVACTSASSEVTTCGGIAGVECDAGKFCDLEAGSCGVKDASGTCVAVPEICPKDYRPVCGCDGQTHANDCQRQTAKVAKDHDGECRPEKP